MSEALRERKKRQTRRGISEAALTLFLSQGYEHTTIAQIAAAADVSVRTVFNHFPAKEDTLFGDDEAVTVALQVIRDHRPGEAVADLLARAAEAMLADFEGTGTGEARLTADYVNLVRTVPVLHARALRANQHAQQRIALALSEAYSHLDPITAAALVGSLVGAVEGATFMGMALGLTGDELRKALRLGAQIAVDGLRGISPSADCGPSPLILDT